MDEYYKYNFEQQQQQAKQKIISAWLHLYRSLKMDEANLWS